MDLVPPLLTLALLVGSVVFGARVSHWRAAVPVVVIAWGAVMLANFVVAGVGDDDDIGAFVASAFIILLLCVGLVRLGAWLGRRRRGRSN